MRGAAPRSGDLVEASSATLKGLRVDGGWEGASGYVVWFLFSISRSFAKATSFAALAGSAADIGCSSSAGAVGSAVLILGGCTSCLGSSFDPKMEANLDFVGLLAAALPSAEFSFSNLAKNLSIEALESEMTL